MAAEAKRLAIEGMVASAEMTKLAVITGASAGLGAEFARQLRAMGYELLVVARRRERLEGMGGEIWVADLSVEEVVERLARHLEGRGDVAMLVNNAGFGTQGRLAATEWELQMAMHRLHVLATLRLTRAVLPQMKAQGGGSIINVSSIAGMTGLSGSPGAVAYTTTKAGLQGFTLSIAADYAAHGVRANCIIVGTVNTPMVSHLGEEARERRRKGVPMQTEGTGWDVGHAAVYLASDEARWVTGVMLPIDGGFLSVRAWPR